LAARFGVSQSTVHRLVHGITRGLELVEGRGEIRASEELFA